MYSPFHVKALNLAGTAIIAERDVLDSHELHDTIIEFAALEGVYRIEWAPR
jgi:hypothetical protein